jgi:hypothetical protein
MIYPHKEILTSSGTFREMHLHLALSPESWTGDGRHLFLRMSMNDVTRILNAIKQGDIQAADQMLPLIYKELHLL